MFKGFAWGYWWKPLIVSHHLATFHGERPGGSGDKTNLICHVWLVWLYGWKYFMVIHFLLKFNCHRCCGSIYIRCLICHVTLGSRDFVTYRRNLLIVCNHPVKFCDHSHCGSGDILYSVCHVTLWDLVIKGSCDIMEGSSSLYLTTLPGEVAIGNVIHLFYFIYFSSIVICLQDKNLQKAYSLIIKP